MKLATPIFRQNLSGDEVALYELPVLFQVYLTGMVPLAIRPIRPSHIDFNQYYADIRYGDQLRRFGDKNDWRVAIFAHLEDNPELLMLRLWECVEANREGRIALSLDDLVNNK